MSSHDPRIVIHIDPAPARDGVLEVRRAIAADPCGVLGHRWAWLNGGGMACGVCGVRA